MKVIAYTTPDGDELTTIGDVVKGGRSGGKYYDIGTRQLMYARINVDTPHFYHATKSTTTPSGDGGESLIHQLCKLVLLERRALSFHSWGKHYDLTFDQLDEEVEFTSEGRKYRIDVLGQLASSDDRKEPWGGRLAIEIWVTHKTEENKKWAFRRERIPAIEITTPSDMYPKDYRQVTAADLGHLLRRLRALFEKRPYAAFLHDPDYVARSGTDTADAMETATEPGRQSGADDAPGVVVHDEVHLDLRERGSVASAADPPGAPVPSLEADLATELPDPPAAAAANSSPAVREERGRFKLVSWLLSFLRGP